MNWQSIDWHVNWVSTDTLPNVNQYIDWYTSQYNNPHVGWDIDDMSCEYQQMYCPTYPQTLDHKSTNTWPTCWLICWPILDQQYRWSIKHRCLKYTWSQMIISSESRFYCLKQYCKLHVNFGITLAFTYKCWAPEDILLPTQRKVFRNFKRESGLKCQYKPRGMGEIQTKR